MRGIGLVAALIEIAAEGAAARQPAAVEAVADEILGKQRFHAPEPVAAFGAACADIGRPESRAALSAAYAAVCAALSGIARLHIPPEHLESVLLVSVPGYKSETAVNWLAEKGICLSASSACSTKKKTNRVLADFGLSPEDAESALRVGISRFTTAEEAKALAEALTQMKTEVRRCR